MNGKNNQGKSGTNSSHVEHACIRDSTVRLDLNLLEKAVGNRVEKMA